jgi:hypothetical protein
MIHRTTTQRNAIRTTAIIDGAARRLMTPFTLAALIAGAALLHSTPGRADSNSAGGCQTAVLTGASQVDPATSAFVGGGTLTLGDDVQDVTWVSTIQSSVANPDGTLALTSSHHITSENGSVDFTTLDAVSAIPTDIPGTYTFASHLLVQTGSGHIKSGSLNVIGRVDLVHGHVVVDSSSGTLCAKP